MGTPASGSGPGAAADLAGAHHRLLADKALQFDITAPPKVQPPPNWLTQLLSALVPYLKIIFWGGVIVAALLILAFLIREIIKVRWQGKAKRKKSADAMAEAWRPTAEQARLLLAEVDGLAAEGRFAEAAHHLLLHSIQDVEDHRPRLIRPSLTSRDIAAMDGLPAEARSAFGKIADIVERSLFGGRAVDAVGFAECRRAYEGFAFGGQWA
ncbi:hypothetical protein BH11PSE2_BH11PSE2_13620 [soil metagenome]